MTNNDHNQSPADPADLSDEPVFRMEGVSKRRPGASGFILSAPALTIRRGEKAALVGFSGCGKSTLLDLMAMVLRPDDVERFTFTPGNGRTLDVLEAWRAGDLNALARTRLRNMGYVLQTGGLLPFLTVRENIDVGRRGLGLPLTGVVEELAARLGIERHLEKRPSKLSVGERQRVAIARAMAHEPSVVLADEPTASLDPIRAEEIMGLFTRLVEDTGVTLILATHDLKRVRAHGFRKITFDLTRDPANNAVRALVSG
ncbi:MAG: ABC transporter ATP-binding protein [Desulfobacterales bacterium]|nr:ABC transporter ATP-binding protein [Desulfobacterales bacterium]